MDFRAYALGAFAALGLTAGTASTAQAADLEEIAAFALSICDAVNATGIVISSADHCMKFSGEFSYEKNFYWSGGSFSSEGIAELDLLVEVMGDSDFGVTRGWIDFAFELNGCLVTGDGEYSYQCFGIDEIGISIGNTTVLATGAGATIYNHGQDETLNHLLAEEVTDDPDAYNKGVYVSLTHDLGNGWSIAKSIECIDSCSNYPTFIGVVSYDKDGIVGHLTVAFGEFNGTWIGFDSLHAGIEAEFDIVTLQAALEISYGGTWAATASILATLELVELAGGFWLDDSGNWAAIFSVQFDAGDFTVAKAFKLWDDGDWEFEAEVGTDLSDTLSLAVNFYVDSSSFWDIDKVVTWSPGGGYELETEIGFDSDGDISAETTVTLAF